MPERDLFYCMTKKMNISLTLAALAVWMFVGAAQCQFLGPSAQRDVEQGAEVAKLVEQQIGVYPAPKTEAYLREVGGRLTTVVNDPRWKYFFQIVD